MGLMMPLALNLLSLLPKVTDGADDNGCDGGDHNHDDDCDGTDHASCRFFPR